MKQTICTIAGIAGGFIASAFGGWDAAMTTLVIFMVIDYISGLLDGKCGNGGEREQRLTAAGYDYEAVQTRVNAIVAEKQSKSLGA